MKKKLHTPSEWLLGHRSRMFHRPKTISITGGKGGVGKTSVALKIANNLIDYDQRVLLVDFDTNLSNTRIKMGLPLENKLVELLQGKISVQNAIFRGPRFHLLSGGNGDLDLFELQESHLEKFIIEVISQVEKEYDVILIDCPAGLARQTLNLNAYCDHRILVVTPDRSSVTDAYGLMKILKSKYGIQENHLIVNKCETSDQYSRVVKTLSDTAENFLQISTSVLGMISKAEISQSGFDHFFLFDRNAKTEQEFIKILEAMTEKCLENCHLPKQGFAGNLATVNG